MITARLFKPSESTTAGRALYAAAVTQARKPEFYKAGVPDTPEGRFELYVLHVILVLHRLKGAGPRAADVSQAMFDAFLRGLDDGLRDMGVGDLSVGKKMRKLGEAFYGRARSYDAAVTELPATEALQEVLRRTVLDGGDVTAAALMADYVARSVDDLRAQSLDRLLSAEISWPEFADGR